MGFVIKMGLILNRVSIGLVVFNGGILLDEQKLIRLKLWRS